MVYILHADGELIHRW